MRLHKGRSQSRRDDPRDIVTTACNFNLPEFIKAGYGKHLLILEQETRAFRQDDDYNDDEKQKIVLKSLLLLAYAKKSSLSVRKVKKGLYHSPLLLTLVNSVNTEDADLKLFFREIERIGKGRISKPLLAAAKQELWEEQKTRPHFMFEEEGLIVEEDEILALSLDDVLKSVYNGTRAGEIEVLVRPSNKQELALKLKTSDRPFALIKIGDITAGWLKDELGGYEIIEGFDDESYFARLNSDESDINILMGSRSFYEGWDSNRPNVVNFINIGGPDAKKFILQSIGRGVRIEPIKDKRKRLLPLYNSKQVDETIFHKVQSNVQPLETLFIFGTNRKALQTVIEHLKNESRAGEQHQLSLFVNEAAQGRTLLIPIYKRAKESLADKQQTSKFEINADDLTVLKNYVEYVGDNRVLVALHDAEPSKLKVLQKSLSHPDDFYFKEGRGFKNVNVMVNRVLDYFSIIPEEFEQMKELEDEIRHFKQITVGLRDIAELENGIRAVSEFEDPTKLKAELRKKLEKKEITLDEYDAGIERTTKIAREAKVEYEAKKLRIKHFANHYYIPIILSDETERINYIKHIIQNESERRFLNSLDDYLEKPNNKFKQFDWWLFSKIDESLDRVYIPHYNPRGNRIAAFYPDFIFWLQRGNDYYIVFVDPKGTTHADYQHKVDWYKTLFEQGGSPKPLMYGRLKTRVFVFLKTDDIANVGMEYRRFWFDNVENALTAIL